MSWKLKTVVRILLIVAKWIADDEQRKDIETLAIQIATYRGES